MDTKQRSQPEITLVSGRISEVDEAYPRLLRVSWLVLVPVLLLAALGSLPILLLSTLRGSPTTGGGGRSLKELRKGPEIPITPVRILGDDGETIELEVHGYVRSDRLLSKDRVRAELHPQRRADLPHRAHRIDNFTTGQTIRTHPNTIWGHLGLALLLQAVLGLALVVLIVVVQVVSP